MGKGEASGLHAAGTPVIRASFGRGELSFHGYAPKRVAHLLAAIDFDDADPGVATFEDVVVRPGERSLFRSDGVRIVEAERDYVGPDARGRGELARDMSDATVSGAADGCMVHRRPVLFLGGLSWHYGHILCDVLARAWALAVCDPALDLLLTPSAADPFAAEPLGTLLRLAGIGPDRVVRFDRPTRIARLVCPLPALRWSERAFSVFDQPHRRIGQALLRDAARDDRPVYLSRRGLPAGQRKIDGEAELEGRLARQGFRVVRPETLSLADQAALFQQDHPVIGMQGSALHGLLFRLNPPPKRVGVLCDDDIHGRFPLIDAVKGSAGHYLRCLEPAPTGSGAPMRVDVDRAMALLDAAGLFGAAIGAAAGPPAVPTMRGREELVREGRAIAYDKDNIGVSEMAALHAGDWARIVTPAGARWMAIVEARAGGKTKLVAVRPDTVPRYPARRLFRPLSSLRRIISRLRREMWSMKRTPFR